VQPDEGMEEDSAVVSYADFAVLAAFVFVYSIVAGRRSDCVLHLCSPPTAWCLDHSVPGLGRLKLEVDGESRRYVAELTLAFSIEANGKINF
jgi:hypothetical protein